MKKQQIFIFEGPDRCGKSSIAVELSEITNIPLFKASDQNDTFLNKQDKFIKDLRYADPRVADLLKQTGYSLIFDRAYPSEFVYSQFMNRNTDMKALKHVDDMYSDLGATIIICYRSSYVGIIDDLNSKIDENLLVDIDEAYKGFMKWTSCRTMLLNVDDENLHREINDIEIALGL